MRPACGIGLLAAMLSGCGGAMTCPRVLFLDGAGWYTGDGPVRQGLGRAGFAGQVERFGWSSMLGPLPDHVLASGAHPGARALAGRITKLRQASPDGRIIVMGMSAGSAIVVGALEKLPPGVLVDHVVLLSPSVSSHRDLSEALRHVRGRLYATSSRHDSLLASAPGSAGLERGRPAGIDGFRRPSGIAQREGRLYDKLVNLPWRSSYIVYGWDGGHLSVTSSDFIQTVIAPRILDDRLHPLDGPLAAREDRPL